MSDYTNDGPEPSVHKSSLSTFVSKIGGAKVVSGFLGMMLLAGGIGAGIILVTQPQLLQQQAATNYDSCGSGYSCNNFTGSGACTNVGGQVELGCTTNNGTTGNCCVPNAVVVTCGGATKPSKCPSGTTGSLVCKNGAWTCGISCTTGNLGSLCTDGCLPGKAAYNVRRSDCTIYCDSGLYGDKCTHNVSTTSCKDSSGNPLNLTTAPTLTCGNLPGGSCGGYQTCSLGQNYNACDPIPGTNQCSYETKVNGVTVSCTGQCPGNIPSDFARCTCSNGVTTIGKLAPGGSCDQLCACTGNVCTGGSCGGTNPTPPPPVKTPTPTPKPSPTPTRSPSPSPTPTPTPGTCVTCQYQADLYWGPVITSFAGNVRYSTANRLITANSVTSAQPVCALTPVSVLPTPAIPVLSSSCANPVANGYLTGTVDNSHIWGTEGYLVGTITNHTASCTYDVGFASYKTNGGTIDTQNLYDNKSISLAPGQTQKIYIKVPKVNDAASCHTIPVTPTPTPIAAQCLGTTIFSPTWTPITVANFYNLPVGGKVYFCTKGTATSGSFDKARFTINGVLRPEVTLLRPGTTEFCDLYTIPANTYSFAVQGEIHHALLGWK